MGFKFTAQSVMTLQLQPLIGSSPMDQKLALQAQTFERDITTMELQCFKLELTVG